MRQIRLMVKIVGIGVLFCLCSGSSDASATGFSVRQSTREIPVAYDVDVLVLGGTTGGIAAATEAAKAGASVLLVTPYPYLGEDRTATLRLWPGKGESEDDPLAMLLANDPYRDRKSEIDIVYDTLLRSDKRLPFTYTIAEPIDRTHPEIASPGRLGDGKIDDPVTESLQVNGDATITVDLGRKARLGQITLLAFERGGGEKAFKVDSIVLATSDDATNWKPAPQTLQADKRTDLSGSHTNDAVVPYTLLPDQPLETRYLRLNIRKTAESTRLLLAELFLFSEKPTLPPASLPSGDAFCCPRPMHIKRMLDQTLLNAGVPFLFNTFAAGSIQTADGEPCGVVIANRNGRQAVIAKKVLDTRVKPTSLAKAGFVVIGGDPEKQIDLKPFPLLQSVTVESVGVPFRGPENGIMPGRPAPPKGRHKGVLVDYPIVNYVFQVAVPEGARPDDLAFRAKLEEQIRLATYTPAQAFTADEIYFETPLESLTVWRARGKELAAAASKIKLPPWETLSVTAQGVPSAVSLPGDINEIPHGIRPGFELSRPNAPRIKDPARDIPVLADYDVVVVGGGTSGAPAGIAAGRQGVRTLVLEHLHDLGGVGTAGAISVYWYGNRVGFTKEVQDGQHRWNIEAKIHWWREQLAAANTDVWHGVLAEGAFVEGNRVQGVLIATPFGIGIVTAKCVIDATGNADIAAAAGASTHFVDDKEIAVQGAGLAPRNLGASYTNTDYMFVDETDIIDSSHVFVYAKEKFPAAFDLGKLLSTRERRRILGEFSFTVLDQINGRTYPDAIVYAYSDYDTHGYTIDPYMELNHPFYNHGQLKRGEARPDRLYAYVPYRSSIPKGFEGILVSGLATSCHRDALPIIRMQPDLQNQGYALGCAAAMLVKSGITEVRKLDVRQLQKHLVDIGNLNVEVLEQDDNYGASLARLPDAVATLATEFRTQVPLVMWYPDAARPLVRQAYLEAQDPEAKLIHAKVAAALGDSIGVPTMLEHLETFQEWDKGWNFRGMGQAGAATSPLDQWIMMIGRTKDRRAVAPIVAKLKLLDQKSDFSHHRAALLALENIGGREAAVALAEHLAKPDMTGYVHDTIDKAKRFDREAPGGSNQEKARRDSLIEISVARALYRCGDVDGRGEAVLRAYTNDLRGYFARHAHAVLEKGKP